MLVHVLDYGAGNVRSLLNALVSLGYAPCVCRARLKPPAGLTLKKM